MITTCGDFTKMKLQRGPDVYWSNSYQLLNAANGVIFGIERLDPSVFTENRLQELLGEAKFLRAYGHFQILAYFGPFYNCSHPPKDSIPRSLEGKVKYELEVLFDKSFFSKHFKK